MELQFKIFPWLENVKKGIADKTITSNLTNSKMIQLLEALRVTFLQDAPLLQEISPNHPIFAHPVFHLPEYMEWKQIQLAATCPKKEDDQLKRAQINNVKPY